MKNTKLKIEEAEFFLSQMSRENRGSKTFNFYLNAFVSSARSITWILRFEFSDSVNWRSWYDSKIPTQEEKLLLKYFNDLRIESVKVKPLTTSNQFELSIPKEEVTDELLYKIEKLIGKNTILILATEDDEIEKLKGNINNNDILVKASLNSVIVKVSNLDKDIDIINTSRKYLESLKSLVGECEKKFMPNN
jgi:hypothetical protein